MWDTADRSAFIDPDMPGYALATKADASTVGGLFRLASNDSFGVMSGFTASLLCEAEFSPALNEEITIDGTAYRVANLEKSNPGWVRCHLK